MIIKKVDETTVKVVLSFEDLASREITEDDLLGKSPKLDKLIQEILPELTSEMEFSSRSLLRIQMGSTTKRGMELVISKTEPGEKFDNFENECFDESSEISQILEQIKRQQDKYQRTKSLPKPTPLRNYILYEFNDFEDVLSACSQVSLPTTLESSLYVENRTYYLLVKGMKFRRDETEFLLQEFGKLSTKTLPAVIERAKLLMENSAIEQLVKTFFVKE